MPAPVDEPVVVGALWAQAASSEMAANAPSNFIFMGVEFLSDGA
jgi:hypothetical protein